MTTTHPNAAARNTIRALRRIAIGRCRRAGADGECGSVEITTTLGALTCHARPSRTSADGAPLFHTWFDLNGKLLSHDELEDILSRPGPSA